MRSAYQLLCHLQQSFFIEGITKCNYYQQIRLRHRPTQLDTAKTKESKCDPPVPEERSFWGIFKKNKKECKGAEKQEKKQKVNCETLPPIAPQEQVECELTKLSEELGGIAYRTCGSAYIVQKDTIGEMDVKTEPEEGILREMLKDPSLKGQCDPMPGFESVEKRLVDLSERKLHPSYKMLMSIPKRPPPSTLKAPGKPYQVKSGPLLPDEIPPHLKIDREMFDKKNIYFEFKKALPPKQLLSRMVEMRQNETPTMQRKIEDKKKAKESSK